MSLLPLLLLAGWATDQEHSPLFEEKLLATLPEDVDPIGFNLWARGPDTSAFKIRRKDGSVAYTAQANGKWHLVVNGKKSDPFDAVSGPIFSSDGKRIAFGARNGRKVLWKVTTVP